MDHTHVGEPVDAGDPPISISHIIHTLGRYTGAIVLTLAAIMLTYLLIAVAMYVTAPASRVTSLPFRLEFQGAALGRYPNGVRFSGADIISTPILLTVYRKNNLQKFMDFQTFSGSLVVVENNEALKRLSVEFEDRLRDPKLSPVDRDRIQREYEAKRESLAKNEYAVNFINSRDNTLVPPETLTKVLTDVVEEWARVAAIEQRVLIYRIAVVSPNVLEQQSVPSNDPLIALHVLRSHIQHVIDNMHELEQLPGAELARTEKDKVSLQELEIRVDEILRFRLEPLVRVAAAMSPDRSFAVSFLESQLAYDERRRQAAQSQIDSIRNALSTYTGETEQPQLAGTSTAAPSTPRQPLASGNEMLMANLNESFVDRLINLSAHGKEVDYRQGLVTDLRKAAEELIPLEQAVIYDRAVLDQVRTTPIATRMDQATLQQEITTIRAQTRQVIQRVNEIHGVISKYLNPAQHMFTYTSVPTSRVERSVGMTQLILYGMVLFLVALPIVLAACLIHARVREEDEAEHRAAVAQ